MIDVNKAIQQINQTKWKKNGNPVLIPHMPRVRGSQLPLGTPNCKLRKRASFSSSSLESLCMSLEGWDICRCLMTTEQFIQQMGHRALEEQRVPHFPCSGQHQIRTGERAKSGGPTSLGGILYALARNCVESGGEEAASHKGERR